MASRLRDRDQPAWLLIGARLLLLVEAVGLGATFARWGLLALWYYPLVGLGLYLLPTLALGVPALGIALRRRLNLRGGRMSLFLAANTLGVLTDILVALSKPDPVPEFVALGAVTLGATLLLVLAAYRPSAAVMWIAAGGLPLLFGYAATYALPPTLAPALALHLEGVLDVPFSAHTVVPASGGDDITSRLRYIMGPDLQSSRIVGTVNPGTYRMGQRCSLTDELTWSTVDVPIAATVIAPDHCQAQGTLQGFVGRKVCAGPTAANCTIVPVASENLGLWQAPNGINLEITTNRTGRYSIELPPDTYRLISGRLVAGGDQQTVVVQSRTTTVADIVFGQ